MGKPLLQELIIPLHSTIIPLAPPCSGKRRFCRGIAKHHPKVLHVETGELLRQTKDPEIESVMAEGNNVDDDVVVKLTKQHVEGGFNHHLHHFLLLDGLPRNVKQFGALAGLTIGRIYIVHLKVSDDMVRRRFLRSIENDPERKSRPDNDLKVFEGRLRDYRRIEPRLLAEASRMGITVFKREISNTDHAAEEFHRIHIAGLPPNRRPAGAHPHHH